LPCAIRREQCDYHDYDTKARMRKPLLSSTVLILSALSSGQASPAISVQAAQPSSSYYRTTQFIDARDIGVDCTGITASDSVLNSFTNGAGSLKGKLVGKTLYFPNGCNVHLQNTWLILNQASFTIRGASRPGAAAR